MAIDRKTRVEPVQCIDRRIKLIERAGSARLPGTFYGMKPARAKKISKTTHTNAVRPFGEARSSCE